MWDDRTLDSVQFMVDDHGWVCEHCGDCGSVDDLQRGEQYGDIVFYCPMCGQQVEVE